MMFVYPCHFEKISFLSFLGTKPGQVSDARHFLCHFDECAREEILSFPCLLEDFSHRSLRSLRSDAYPGCVAGNDM